MRLPPSAPNTTCWATATSPPTPTGACTPCARWRTSPSPAPPISAYPHLIDAPGRRQGGRRARQPGTGPAGAARADAIVEACQEIRDGKLHEQFVVDVIQGGAGTSTNMNANEVIANRALELLGHARATTRACTPTTTST